MGKFTDCEGCESPWCSVHKECVNKTVEDEMAMHETQRWSPEILALHEISIIAENTIPPDGPEAAYWALDEILKIILPFRKYK